MLNWLKKLFTRPTQAAPDDPEFWKVYLQSINNQPANSTPLHEAVFVVFDTETTGLDTKTNKVLSIGAVKVQGQQVLVHDSFECLVQQEVEQGNKSPEVHGILPSQVQLGLTEQEALKAFLTFAGNAILVGHHVKFDTDMLNGMLRRSGIQGKLYNRSIDTAQLAQRLERFRQSPDSFSRSDYSLDALSQKYNLPTEARHTAPGDAFTTAILLLKLMALAKKRGIRTVGELVR
ncbi:3'-5' exonuclease [Pontibacter cellulosilyticus]|uniref:3'-5' exonuclease n=1 Tax=Pontibacter cellulosilyticus TaxID=1720253 RepID=A0A923SNG4_9BACT|nr:3'-5' exonuclease [Pontibacter cellulosilyticus]MBC5993175.1 3'-5' exonuclease [Pontibacter cellulosilyticus]